MKLIRTILCCAVVLGSGAVLAEDTYGGDQDSVIDQPPTRPQYSRDAWADSVLSGGSGPSFPTKVTPIPDPCADPATTCEPGDDEGGAGNPVPPPPPPPDDVEYFWYQTDTAYGPGIGCNWPGDSASAQSMVARGELKPGSLEPTQVCNSASVGAAVMVYHSCAGWGPSGIEGKSGWVCVNSNGEGYDGWQ